MNLKSFPFLLLVLSSVSLFNIAPISVAQEVQSSYRETTFFIRSPLLVDAHTTSGAPLAKYATYFFDLEIPEDAGKSLQKISIAQRQGSKEIDFRLEGTRAFMGNHRRKQEPITLTNVAQDESKVIEVIFATPIEPGSKLTIGIKPKQNPFNGGVYLFGITAFPKGENAQGLYLGAGRIQIFSRF